MNLTLSERFVLIGILPAEGNFLTMKRLRELREALSPSDAEQKEFGIKEIKDAEGRKTGGLSWDSTHSAIERVIEIGESMTDLIVKVLKKLDDTNKLGLTHLTLYEKFVERKGEAPAREKPNADP
jgi:hypothetical protein